MQFNVPFYAHHALKAFDVVTVLELSKASLRGTVSLHCDVLSLNKLKLNLHFDVKVTLNMHYFYLFFCQAMHISKKPTESHGCAC